MKRLTLAIAGAAFALAAAAADVAPSKNAGPYVPSPESVVADMLKVAEVGPQDYVIDLGSGDGRIVLTAAKVFGAQGFGVGLADLDAGEAGDAQDFVVGEHKWAAPL